MIDLKFLRENPEVVKENIKKKFQDHKLPLVDEVIELDAKARAAQSEADELRAEGFPGAVAHIFALVVHQEVRHDREAFHVVDAGGKREQAADFHEGRLHARTARLALNGADQRRAFAADVSACAGV